MLKMCKLYFDVQRKSQPVVLRPFFNPQLKSSFYWESVLLHQTTMVHVRTLSEKDFRALLSSLYFFKCLKKYSFYCAFLTMWLISKSRISEHGPINSQNSTMVIGWLLILMGSWRCSDIQKSMISSLVVEVFRVILVLAPKSSMNCLLSVWWFILIWKPASNEGVISIFEKLPWAVLTGESTCE